jgi:predicted molibdopterin-dependent oxidoreductase YjgC
MSAELDPRAAAAPTAATATIDGRTVELRPNETVLEAAARLGTKIPTLCHDSRLEPAGACRSCLVEIDGQRRLAPACATRAGDGMVVRTSTERVRRHQRALLALYLADQPDAGQGPLGALARELGAPTDWPKLESRRAERREDPNPYIQFEADRCILCARCTRYCEAVESVSAIWLAGRGSETTIATADAKSLLDSSCELCGGCVAVCPSGALSEKMPKQAGLRTEGLTPVRSTCNFCGVGCQLDLQVDPDAFEGRGQVVKVTSPPPGTVPNDGNLCVKGRFAYNFIEHEDRLKVPLVKGADGQLREASWDEAIRVAAEGLMRVKARHGADGLGFVSSSRCTGEENYLMQKLSRAAFGTNNCHQCAAT